LRTRSALGSTHPRAPELRRVASRGRVGVSDTARAGCEPGHQRRVARCGWRPRTGRRRPSCSAAPASARAGSSARRGRRRRTRATTLDRLSTAPSLKGRSERQTDRATKAAFRASLKLRLTALLLAIVATAVAETTIRNDDLPLALAGIGMILGSATAVTRGHPLRFFDDNSSPEAQKRSVQTQKRTLLVAAIPFIVMVLAYHDRLR
jgi:hypothetical protein